MRNGGAVLLLLASWLPPRLIEYTPEAILCGSRHTKEPLFGTAVGSPVVLSAAVPRSHAMLGPRSATETVEYSRPPFHFTSRSPPVRTDVNDVGDTRTIGTSTQAIVLQACDVAGLVGHLLSAAGWLFESMQAIVRVCVPVAQVRLHFPHTEMRQ